MLFDRIIRAWKDPEFRLSLSEEEQEALPANPAGAIELTDDDLDMVAGGHHSHSYSAARSYSSNSAPRSYNSAARSYNSNSSAQSYNNNSASQSYNNSAQRSYNSNSAWRSYNSNSAPRSNSTRSSQTYAWRRPW